MRLVLSFVLLCLVVNSYGQENQDLYGCDMLNCVLRDSDINQKFVIDNRVLTPISMLDQRHYLGNCKELHTKKMTIEVAEEDDKYGGDKIGSQLELVKITARDSVYVVQIYDESLRLFGTAELKKNNNRYYIASRKFNYRDE